MGLQFLYQFRLIYPEWQFFAAIVSPIGTKMYLEMQDLAIQPFGIATVIRKAGYRHLNGIEVSLVRD